MALRHLLLPLFAALAAPAPALAAPPAFEEIPKIDVHSHIFEDVPEVVEMMDRNRIRIVNVCVRGTDPERLRRAQETAERQQATYGRERFPFASTFDLTRRDEADYVDQVKRWLDASFEKGAVMVKIWKEVGMEIKDRQGRFILPDDPLFDPIYAFIAERGKPLLAHLAEPLDAWRPLDPESVHYGYYSKNPEWHLHGREGFPSHAELVAARDRILERHPRLTVIGAHLGSLEHDVDELARRFDRHPNFYVDCSARTADLTRQPADKVRAFLVRYQDRVLYGLDRSRRPDPQRESSAEERAAFARALEEDYRRDFRYYAGEGEMEYRGRKVRSLALPREVLEKLFHANAERIIPGLAAAPAPPHAASAPPAAPPPNIVLIYADDLGYGDVSSYGATRFRTPRIDSLASRGLRLTNAHASAATCTPSRYAMLTGEYAWRRKGTGVLPGDARLVIEPGRTTLASLLGQRGYATGVVGKWHLGLGDGRIDWNGEIRPGPREIGFDEAFLIPATGDRVPCVYVENGRVVGLDAGDPIEVSYGDPIGDEPTGKAHPELLKMHPSHGHDQTIVNGISRIGYMRGGRAARWVDEDMADVITARATAFLEKHRERPFFLYYATHDIHVPRVPHARFAGRSGLGPRGDVILQLDWATGEILDALDRLGLADRTLVLFTSDNGPVVDDGYRDEAVEKLGDHRPAGPLRGGKYSAFDGGTRVPFLVRWPGRVAPGVSDALVSQVDLLASFAALTGRPLGPADGPDSIDVLAALLGDSNAGRDHLVEQAGTLSILSGRWKLIAPGDGPAFARHTSTELGNDPQPQLYDLATDLGERTNVAAEHPELVRGLTERLEKIRKDGRSRP